MAIVDRVLRRALAAAEDPAKRVLVVKAGPLGPGDTRHEIVLDIAGVRYRWEGSYNMVDEFRRRARYGPWKALRWLEGIWGKGAKL